MGKFADFMNNQNVKMTEKDEYTKNFNDLVDKVKGIFLDTENFKDLKSEPGCFYVLTLKTDDVVKPFQQILSAIGKTTVRYKDTELYKSQWGKTTFEILGCSKDIDEVFADIGKAFDSLKR